MKKVYFRIAELEKHQVLIEKDFDNDSDEVSLIVITFHINGVKVKKSFGYENEENRDRVFDEITNEQLEKSIESSLSMIGN